MSCPARSCSTSRRQVWNSNLVSLRLEPQLSQILLLQLACRLVIITDLGSLTCIAFVCIILITFSIQILGSQSHRAESDSWRLHLLTGHLISLPRPNVVGKQHISGFVTKLLEGNHHPVWERWLNKVSKMSRLNWTIVKEYASYTCRKFLNTFKGAFPISKISCKRQVQGLGWDHEPSGGYFILSYVQCWFTAKRNTRWAESCLSSTSSHPPRLPGDVQQVFHRMTHCSWRRYQELRMPAAWYRGGSCKQADHCFTRSPETPQLGLPLPASWLLRKGISQHWVTGMPIRQAWESLQRAGSASTRSHNLLRLGLMTQTRHSSQSPVSWEPLLVFLATDELSPLKNSCNPVHT